MHISSQKLSIATGTSTFLELGNYSHIGKEGFAAEGKTKGKHRKEGFGNYWKKGRSKVC